MDAASEQQLVGDVSALKGDMASLKGDFAGVKGDVSTLKSDMAGVKVEVSTAKTEMAELREEMRDVGKNVAELDVHQRYSRDGLRELGKTVDGIDSDVDEVKDSLHEMKGAAAAQTAAMQAQTTAMQDMHAVLSKFTTPNGAVAPPAYGVVAAVAAAPVLVADETAQDNVVSIYIGKYLFLPFLKKGGPIIATALATALATWIGLRMLNSQKVGTSPADTHTSATFDRGGAPMAEAIHRRRRDFVGPVSPVAGTPVLPDAAAPSVSAGTPPPR